MAAEVLDGKGLARRVRQELKEQVAALADGVGRGPCLAVVLVGDDPASQIYVSSKEKAAARIGMTSIARRLPADCDQATLEATLAELAADDGVDGILLQLPLPRGLDSDAALLVIPPEKDVDGLHPRNIGELAIGHEHLVPCTPRGVIRLLDDAGFAYQGAAALVIGRSRLVGRPMAFLLTNRSATVTVAHSRSRDLPALVGAADLVVAAVGKRGLVEGAWLRPGAWVVDVGIHRLEDGTLCGDVDYASARDRAARITPVPGGVGPMTIAMLLENTLLACRARLGR